MVASADKDLLALVTDEVEVHSTRTGNRIGPAEVREKLGVDPCQVVDYLTLVGDASDNIRGAKGIGPKTAAALLGMFGNVDDVYRAIDTGDAFLKAAQLDSLDELRPRLDAVRALVQMRTDVPLDVAQVFNERVPKAAAAFMEEDEMDEELPSAEDVRGIIPQTKTVEDPGMTAEEVNDRLRDHERKFGPAKPTALAPVVESAS